MKSKFLTAISILILMVSSLPASVGAAPAPPIDGLGLLLGSPVDDAPHPLGDMQRDERAIGFEAMVNGKTHGHSHKVRHGRYVELDRLGEDSIWTITAEFSDAIHPVTQGTPGPLHNQIPEPDRRVDNTTIWTSDFNNSYYEDLLFSEAHNDISMRNYYIEQSSNRYTVNGDVTDWVQVPYNEARYGTNLCGDIVCSTVWDFVQDGADAWYDSQINAGMTPADIDAYLSQFDVWDRYDWDSDGNFDEPDGYIDHFQIIHSGEGEETGGGAQGTDAIWSHRWYAFFNLIGVDGPSPDYLLGGVHIGNSSYWIGDYTVEPENGGVGVFAHEFGHDLGLPDLYDTSGNTGGAENSVGFWSLYASGSYGSSGRPRDGIGTKPVHMSAYEKIFLGWSNLAIVDFGDRTTLKLGPAEYNTIDPQQLMVLLPDKLVEFSLGDPFAGDYFYHSGSGNNLNNTMIRAVTLPGGTVSLTAKVNYEIETDWDYAYLTIDGTPVATNLSTNSDPNGQNFGEGITGSSGGAWVDLTADLSAWAGQTVDIGFLYWTDGAVAEAGLSVDNIDITGLPLDDAETDPGWTYVGFERTTGVVEKSFFNAYIAEFRQYEGYDRSLRTGPYNFGFLDNPNRQNWVEHFPYQDGLLVWYYDESFPDNNVGDHCADGRCGGLFLPVDAHPDLLLRPDGQVWRPRIQSYDATFGLDRTDRICVHLNSVRKCYGRLRANRTFDDTKNYWVPPDPSIGNFGWSSVPLPGFGVKIRVLQVKDGGHHRSRHHSADWMRVRVGFDID